MKLTAFNFSYSRADQIGAHCNCGHDMVRGFNRLRVFLLIKEI